MELFIFLLQCFLVPAVAPFAVGLIRKVKARMQNRVGASVLQPYFDLYKLFHKDEVISRDASWIFRFAPYLIFSVTLVIGASVPLVTTMAPALFEGSAFPFSFFAVGDFITLVYLFALTTFFLALAGMDAGSGFGGFGSSREMTMAALAEGGLFFSLLVASVIAQSGNIMTMIESLQVTPFQAYIPLVIAFIAFFIALLAENSRFPVDNPATHLELTMIHEAMILEYSGKRLALIEWASFSKLLIFVALGANVFFPWGVATSFLPEMLGMATLLFVLKAGAILVAIAFIESTMAKFRIFRVPDLLFTSFVLSVIALSVTITL
ncbi:MAG: NADH-quinone oxidoreductase subunit H [Candidatus Moranbacteria bacterium]|nr:NADH-quinone oxidoreductase subunit H [Candidatus Moranbacteria bacterium]